VAAAAFHPNDLSPDYFDETERTFNGSTFHETDIYSTPFTKNYIYFFIKLKSTNLTSQSNNYFGGRATASANTGDVLIACNDGTFNKRPWARYRTDQVFVLLNDDGNFEVNTDKVVAYTFDYIGNELKIFTDGELRRTITTMPTRPVEQTTRKMYLGNFNNNGNPVTSGLIGTTKGIFIKGSDSALTAGNISDLQDYFAAL
jgi:hypothetical protein